MTEAWTIQRCEVFHVTPAFAVKVRSCRTGSNRGCIATSARKLPPWRSPSPTVCSQCPRNARLTMARFITMFRILSKDFRQEVASVAIAWSWTWSMRCPAFHRPNAMLASRCAWVFSCDFDLHSEVLRVARHTVDPLFIALPMDSRNHPAWQYSIQFNLFIQPGLPSEVSSSSAVVVSKNSGFYSCWPPHCPVDASALVCLHHRRHTGADVYPTDTSQWSWTRHALISTDTTYNSEWINAVYGRHCRAGPYHAMSVCK